MSTSTSPSPSTSAPEAPPPRKRAVGPRFDALPEFRDPQAASPQQPTTLYSTDPAERLAAVKERRVGPDFVSYSMWAGGAAVAFTYLTGFRALWQKDQPAWAGTFRQRVLIMAPVMTMYAAGTGLIPLPFQASLESLLGRPAVTLMDIQKARKKEAEQSKQAVAAAERAASEARADAEAVQTARR